MSYCFKCDLVKEARVHHCRVCGKCIQRMDHHCPWVGNCVGRLNHKYFILFLFYATVHSLSPRYPTPHLGRSTHRRSRHHRRLALRITTRQFPHQATISDLLLRLHHLIHAGLLHRLPLCHPNDDCSSEHHYPGKLHRRHHQARSLCLSQNVFDRGSVTANLR